MGVLVSTAKYEISAYSLTSTYDPSISVMTESPAAITVSVVMLSPCACALLGAYASALRLIMELGQHDFYRNKILQGGNYLILFFNKTFSSSNWAYLLICH